MVSCFPFGVWQVPVEVLSQSGERGRELSHNTETLSAFVMRVANDIGFHNSLTCSIPCSAVLRVIPVTLLLS